MGGEVFSIAVRVFPQQDVIRLSVPTNCCLHVAKEKTKNEGSNNRRLNGGGSIRHKARSL
jgi:hypothetical protein